MDKAEVAVDDEGQHSPSHDAGAVNADERCPKLRGQQGGRSHGLRKVLRKGGEWDGTSRGFARHCCRLVCDSQRRFAPVQKQSDSHLAHQCEA